MTPYPLAWPETMPRFKSARQQGSFKTALTAAMKNVRDSLRLFAADSGKQITDLVISSNVTLGVDKPADPGVAVWFVWDGMTVCIPVDRYSKVEANLQAIHHIIEARRVELRHGTLALVRATLQGFTALPAPKAKRSWREVLGIQPEAGGIAEAEIEHFYRLAAKKAHPDAPGGSHDKMTELNAARDAALKEISA